MRIILSSLLLAFVSLSTQASQNSDSILYWKSTELSEKAAIRAVKSGVRSFVQEENDCDLEEVWGFEAINDIQDMFGNQVIVVLSTAHASGGSRCQLDKYLDCSTSFYKQGAIWKYETTTCEKESYHQ